MSYVFKDSPLIKSELDLLKTKIDHITLDNLKDNTSCLLIVVEPHEGQFQSQVISFVHPKHLESVLKSLSDWYRSVQTLANERQN